MQPGTTPKQSRKWTHCKRCGKPRAECGPISTRGQCYPCAETATAENARQIHYRSGPLAERRAQGMLRYALALTDSLLSHT